MEFIKLDPIPVGNFGPIGPSAVTPEALYLEKFASPINSPSLALITELDLSAAELDVKIITSHKWALACLEKLTVLKLSNNNIESMGFLKFLPVSELEFLDLSWNLISNFTYTSELQIKTLNLSWNTIKNLTKPELQFPDTMQVFKKCNEILLTGNPILNTFNISGGFTDFTTFINNTFPGKLPENNTPHWEIQNYHLIHNLTLESYSVVASPEPSNYIDLAIFNSTKSCSTDSENILSSKIESFSASHTSPEISNRAIFKCTTADANSSRLKYVDFSYTSTRIEDISSVPIFKGIYNKITVLCLEDCGLKNLNGFSSFSELSQLYLSYNCLAQLRDIYNLKLLRNLIVINLTGNPFCDEADYRCFIIYHLCIMSEKSFDEESKALQVLDGSYLNEAEINSAKDMFGGRLSLDSLAEYTGNRTNIYEESIIKMVDQNIRTVSLVSSSEQAIAIFPKLHTLNLENNLLKTVSGLVYFKHVSIFIQQLFSSWYEIR